MVIMLRRTLVQSYSLVCFVKFSDYNFYFQKRTVVKLLCIFPSTQWHWIFGLYNRTLSWRTLGVCKIWYVISNVRYMGQHIEVCYNQIHVITESVISKFYCILIYLLLTVRVFDIQFFIYTMLLLSFCLPVLSTMILLSTTIHFTVYEYMVHIIYIYRIYMVYGVKLDFYFIPLHLASYEADLRKYSRAFLNRVFLLQIELLVLFFPTQKMRPWQNLVLINYHMDNRFVDRHCVDMHLSRVPRVEFDRYFCPFGQGFSILATVIIGVATGPDPPSQFGLGIAQNRWVFWAGKDSRLCMSLRRKQEIWKHFTGQCFIIA